MSTSQLNVLVIGGGIGGLATAAFLRPFAKVTVLESAKAFKPVGAAVCLSSGVVGILRAHGINPTASEYGGVDCTTFQLLTPNSELIATMPFEAGVSIHRGDLHNALFKAATRLDGEGQPAEILMNHRISYVDPEAGVATTEDGTTYTADVIVGADGIRSAVRPSVTGTQDGAVPAGESLYRLLVSIEDLKAQAPQHPLIGPNGLLKPGISVVRTDDRKIVAYPCSGRKALNFAAFIPDLDMHEQASDSWTQPGSVDSLLKAFATFGEQWTNIMRCGKDVGLWQMRDMKPLSGWVKGCTILIGDAAHPMLPHRAAGANSAIEDAEALGHYLRSVSGSAPNVHTVLQHVMRVRFRRASRFQALSHDEGLQGGEKRSRSIVQEGSYPGAARWEIERPDMVLKEGEPIIYVLDE